MPPEPNAAPDERVEPYAEPYAWYMLGVLVVVYVLNFIDRQLLTILAPDLKRDLGISDSDFGFLYGTAFGVFYALFGIPLGKLADRWSRTRLLAIGLALWSAMTVASGFSRNFAQIGAARVGVGIGEATAQPCAYSLISDWFPPRRRATALGIYSSGLYLGGGISLFIGSAIVDRWNAAFAGGSTAPLGLAGWQAAFLVVGVPGILLALLVATLREPPRGRFDAGPPPAFGRSPFAEFMADLADIIPPFTLIGAARRGVGALMANLAVAAGLALGGTLLVRATGDVAQWSAFGIGCYAIFSWIAALRSRDPVAFRLLAGSPAFVGITLGYGGLTFIGYAGTAFGPLYGIQELGGDPKQVGFMMGGLGALGGVLGVLAGGALTDRMARDGDQSKRVLVIGGAAVLMLAFHGLVFSAQGLPAFYLLTFASWVCASATLGAAAGVVVNIVPPQVRGVATAGFLLGTNMIGLALGPYTAGKMSTQLGDLGAGMVSILAISPLSLGLLWLAWSTLRRARTSSAA